MELGQGHSFQPAQSEHRRGAFPALNFGINHGGRPKAPYRLGQRTTDEALIEKLLCDPDIQRLALHQSASFQLWFPDLYEYYQQHMEVVWREGDNLQPNWPKSVYACCTINFGGQVFCFQHRDSNNLAFGMCAITALGDFDEEQGGHIVFDELKLIAEFPHATTCSCPSASLTHSNIPVRPHESRISMTQYSAGPIFRWVDNGCRTEAELKAQDPLRYKQIVAEKKTRWSLGISLLPNVEKYIEM
ncbi:hypothetical protein C8J56DRAFT_852253 [Mycena floridula]|nr:hypothetical protein C8J56DRAFT_852253 [Mycena floridula]